MWVEQWRTWLPELTARLAQRRVLDRRQRLAVWEAVIRDSAASGVLNVAALAAWADDAWITLRMHAATDACERGDTTELAQLREWSQQYTRRLHEHGWADHVDMLKALRQPQVQTALQRRRRELVLLGIADLAPLERQSLDILHANGWHVSSRALPQVASNVRVQQADSPVAEIEAALDWLTRELDSNPRRRVALIAAHDDILEAVVGRRSREWPAVSFARASRPIEVPAVAAALNALEMLGYEGGMRQLSAWLRSPFMQAGDPVSRGAAARFELVWRELPVAQVPLRLVWSTLTTLLADVAPESAVRLQRARALASAADGVAALSDWTVLWRSQLTGLHWLANAAQQERDQAVRVIEHAFDGVAALGAVIGAVTGERALQELRTVLEERLIGSPLPVAGLHVLEHVEDVGPGYAAVWVAGMSRSAWPPRARQNPLLPRQLLGALNVPWATREDCLVRAAATVRRAAGSAPQVRFSYSPNEHDDRAQPAAAVLPWLAAEESSDASSANRKLRSERETGNARTPLEIVVEAPVSLRSRALGGGAALLDKQAACPLRAFIDYRLHVRPPQPLVRGIAPRIRGQILHRAAANLLRAGVSHAEIADRSAAEWDGAVEEAAGKAINRELGDARAWFRSLAEMELQRVCAVLHRLLEADAHRAPFVVDSVELPIRHDVDGFTLSARIDRIDRLADGSTAIVDYKTGRTTARPYWFSDDVADYQMPLYAVALNADVTAIVLCTLGARQIDYRGFWVTDQAFPGRPEKLPDANDWQTQLRLWDREIAELVHDFAAGDYAIDITALPLLSGMYAPLTRIAETLHGEVAALTVAETSQ